MAFLAGRGRLPVMVAVLALAVTASVRGQEYVGGSRNLPVDHWAYEYVQLLRTRGLLTNLNPLVRPYRRVDVARGLAELDPDTLSGPTARWVGLLLDEFRGELRRLDGGDPRPWGIHLAGAAVASTGQRQDVLRPLGNEDVWPRYTSGAWVERGPLAAEARVTFDGQLESDPDGPVDQGRVGRADNAYLSFAFPIGDVWFGRFKQNWSALGSTGLMISDIAPAYPALAYELRAGKFSFRSTTGELETKRDTARQLDFKRYISVHRLDFQTEHVVVSVGEGTLFATRSGLQLRFLNPLEGTVIQVVTRRPGDPNEDVENSVVDGQVWFGWPNFEFYGEFLLDDIDVHPGPLGAEPLTYAFALGARTTAVADWLQLGAQYEQVSSFAYRPPGGIDVWSFVDNGLGENFSDFDRLTLIADLFTPVRGLRLSPTVQIQRQGEGDLRLPTPTDRSELVNSPALFLGIKETTVRLGLRGRYQPNRFFRVTWDLGENFIRNANHLPGRNISDFTAVGTAGVILDLPLSAP